MDTTIYHSTLADIHDRFFKVHSLSAARLVLEKTENPTGTIVDLGCGSGDLLLAFQEAGFQKGFGFDVSEEMIRLSKNKVPDFHFEVADLFDSEIPSANVITMVGEIICYASASHTNDEIAERLLNNIYSSLQPNGYFLFDVALTENDFNYQREFSYPNSKLEMVSELIDGKIKRTLKIMSSDSKELSTEIHWLRLFDDGLMQSRLRAIGFQVEAYNSYMDYQLPPGRLGYLCYKA